MLRKYVLILLLISPELWAVGNLKTLSGILIEDSSGKPLSYATVMISSTGEGVITNELGRFKMKVLPEDSLVIRLMNYKTRTIAVPDSLLDSSELMVISMLPLSYELDQFNVEAEKKTPLALRSEVFKEKPKVYEFFVSPLSYIYYFTNRRERRKRQLLRMIEQEQLMEAFAQVYNREVIANYSLLEGRDLDFCVMYCNAHIDLSPGDTEEDVKQKLLLTLSAYFRQELDKNEKS